MYDSVYAKVVTQPASTLIPLLPQLQALSQSAVQAGDYLQSQGARVSFNDGGVQFPTQEQATQYNTLMSNLASNTQALTQGTKCRTGRFAVSRSAGSSPLPAFSDFRHFLTSAFSVSTECDLAHFQPKIVCDLNHICETNRPVKGDFVTFLPLLRAFFASVAFLQGIFVIKVTFNPLPTQLSVICITLFPDATQCNQLVLESACIQ